MNSKYQEGDLVSFTVEGDIPNFNGTGTIRGVMSTGRCNKINCESSRTFWLIEIKDSPIRSNYKYSCIAVPESCLTLIESHKDSFAKLLDSIHECYRKISDREHCYGLCKELINEGPRSYSRKASIFNGRCTQCHRIAK